MLRISTFDDWTDYFYGWQKVIGLDAPEFKDYRFQAKHGNESSRNLYYEEVKKLTNLLNKSIPEGHPKIIVPDLKFNRQIGQYAGQFYNVLGEPLTAEEYEKYLPTVLPSVEDQRNLASIFKEKGWIQPKKEEESVPSEGARDLNTLIQ
jgi:hypothetical protein